MSESHTDTPRPGGGRRIARPAPDFDQEDIAAKLGEQRDPAHAAARRSHRAAGPPSTLESGPPTGGRRRAGTQSEQPPDRDRSSEPAAGPQTTDDPEWAASTSAPTAYAVASANGDPPAVVAPRPRREDIPPPSERARETPAATTAQETTEEAEDPAAAARQAPASATAEPSAAAHEGWEPVVDEAWEPSVEHEREPTAWDGPIVTATHARPVTPLAETPVEVEDVGAAEPEDEPSGRSLLDAVTAGLVVVGAAAALIAGLQVAEAEGWIDSVADPVVRAGALASTWCAVVALSHRCGGRTVIVGVFTAVVFALAGAFPETWALAGGAVTAGAVFGLLAMVYTRPARGIGLVRELVISASVGVLGALVVSGYHVELRPYRFRMMVLAATLICAFMLAWRLGNGARSIGRRGGTLIVVGVAVLAASLAYLQAVRSWGSPSLVQDLDDFKASVSDLLGAAPRPVEALVGFPALVWGVAVRRRRRQGWWMCAFGALGAAGVTSSLIYPDVGFWSATASSGYDVGIGLAIGLVVVFVDGLLTGGGGRRADETRDRDVDRPEPARFTPLL